MIRVERLEKRFGAIAAVAGVTFQAADGRVTGLLGPNGAGKTTTLRIISSLVRPDRGTAFVDDTAVHENPSRVRSLLGVLPDSRGLYPRLTAREHLEYSGMLHGVQRSRLATRIDQLASLLEMQGIIDRRVAGFSQGERTKVAIGRALVHEPKNVVLDEATSGLDVMSARAVRSAVRHLAESGACVLFSSHIMSEVAEVCDQIVIISGGKVAASGSAQSLLALTRADSLERAFVRIIETPLEAT